MVGVVSVVHICLESRGGSMGDGEKLEPDPLPKENLSSSVQVTYI